MTDYTLDILAKEGGVLLVRLTPPAGGEMESTRIAFLPGGYIVIHGDLCPGGNGLISNPGYGPEWFARGGKRITPAYMAEKFRVPSVFIPERAAEHLTACAEEEGPDRREQFLMLSDDASRLDPDDAGGIEAFLSEVQDATGSPDHAEAFYGPDPDTMDLLIDIQAAFARLYKDTP